MVFNVAATSPRRTPSLAMEGGGGQMFLEQPNASVGGEAVSSRLRVQSRDPERGLGWPQSQSLLWAGLPGRFHYGAH